MTLTGPLVLGVLIAAVVGCASPTRPHPDGAAVTGSSAAGPSAPRFAADGPGAEEYGAREGYPVRFVYRVRFYVGAFSHYDQIFESRMPYAATRYFGYGYQTWIFPGERRMFALLGLHGQAIYVDPSSRLVMVHTAVRKLDDSGAEAVALWRGVVKAFGG